MDQIVVAAQMTKAQITPTHEEFFGKVNAAPVAIGGTVYPEASLVFNGFHGAILTPRDADKYVGVYRFNSNRDVTRVRIDFNRLPGWNAEPQTFTWTEDSAGPSPTVVLPEPNVGDEEKGDE